MKLIFFGLKLVKSVPFYPFKNSFSFILSLHRTIAGLFFLLLPLYVNSQTHASVLSNNRMRIVKMLKEHCFRLFLVLYSVGFMSMQMSVDREYQIKAVFLFNFTQFVDWPPDAFTNQETPLVIGVLGKNPFGNYLKETVSDEKVNGHPLTVHFYNTIEEVKNCHILFINFSEKEKLDQSLAGLKGKSVLTVSDAGTFLKQGGMIRFTTKNDKIQFQINPEVLKGAGLTASSQLLRLADIVVPKKGS